MPGQGRRRDGSLTAMGTDVPEEVPRHGTTGQGHRHGVCPRLLHPCSSLICKRVQVVSPPASPCHVPQPCGWEWGDTHGSRRWHCHGCHWDLPQVPSVVQSGPLCRSVTLSCCFSFPTMSVKQPSMGPQPQSLLLIPREPGFFFFSSFLFSES